MPAVSTCFPSSIRPAMRPRSSACSAVRACWKRTSGCSRTPCDHRLEAATTWLAGSNRAERPRMSIALSLVLLVVASYLAAHVAFEWLGHRLLIVSGAEYLLLGVLLGPHVTGVVSAQQVESFAPVTALALGWMGAIIGSRLRLQQLVRVPAAMYNVALAESAITLGVV